MEANHSSTQKYNPDGGQAQAEPTPNHELQQTAQQESQLQAHAQKALQIRDEQTDKSSSSHTLPPKSLFATSIVQKEHVDLLLLATCFCSGLVDSSMLVAYTTFVSMQTGNTIFIALAISDQGPRPDAWMRPFVAVICFVVGASFFSRLFYYLGAPRRRLTLVINFTMQTIIVTLAAALTQSGVINSDVPESIAANVYPMSLAPIALLAFQSAGQITASRALEIGELPTVVVTSLLCDLFSDPNVFALPPSKNIKRNRRITGFLLTLVGGIIGGWMCKRLGSIAPSLWLAASIKACITVAWVLWPIEKTKKKDFV